MSSYPGQWVKYPCLQVWWNKEFAAAGAGWREMEASTIPLCPGEFGFKSVSLGVQTLAKCRAYYFPLMKIPTCFVIVLLSSWVSLVSCTSKCQSRLDFSMLLSCSLEDLHVPRRQWRKPSLPLMAGPVMFFGHSVWLWLKNMNTVCEQCKLLNMHGQIPS